MFRRAWSDKLPHLAAGVPMAAMAASADRAAGGGAFAFKSYTALGQKILDALRVFGVDSCCSQSQCAQVALLDHTPGFKTSG